MNQVVKNEIRLLSRAFDKSTSYYEKGYILSLIDYLNRIMPNDLDINEMQQDIRLKMCIIAQDFTKYLTLRKEKIDKFMEENREYFDANIKKIELSSEYPYEFLPELEEGNIGYIIEDFLKNTDKNILNFYRKIYSEGRIIYSIENNMALTSLNNSNTIIFIKKLDNLEDIRVFLHELAHAYYIYINNYHINERSSLTTELKDEIPAKIMELKYINYLFQNGAYHESKIIENSFNKGVVECEKNRYDFEHLKYLIASYIALNLKDKEYDLTKYFKYLYNNNIFNIINNINKERSLGKVLKK